MILQLIIGAAVALWAYGVCLCRRWDKWSEAETPVLLTDVLFWWVGIPTMYSTRPPHPWAILDPIPSGQEAVEQAEKCSRQMERDAGLEFDGIFLKPGYTDNPLQYVRIVPLDQVRARLAQVKQELIAIDDEFKGKSMKPMSEAGRRMLNAEHEMLTERARRLVELEQTTSPLDVVSVEG